MALTLLPLIDDQKCFESVRQLRCKRDPPPLLSRAVRCWD